MKALLLLAASAFAAGALAQNSSSSSSKVEPPDHSNPGPGECCVVRTRISTCHAKCVSRVLTAVSVTRGYFISEDIDYISTAGGNIVSRSFHCVLAGPVQHTDAHHTSPPLLPIRICFGQWS